MKKIFFFVAFVAISLLSTAQNNQLVWANGRLLYGTPITNIDSLTYDETAGMDTLLLPRILIKTIYDTIYIHDTVYIDKTNKVGKFSVSADKQVRFSPGNLQYNPANDVWRFATTQTEYIGTANNNISPTYNGWLDLFGWGTGDTPTKSTSTSNSYSTYVDWGTNKIGNDAPNTWRTLSGDEWMYIFYYRPNAQSLFALGNVNGVNGTIVLPDNWTTPVGVNFVASTTKGLYWDGGKYGNSNADNFTHNTYTNEEWEKMEEAGAVFLPAAGDRYYTTTNTIGLSGSYWSSTQLNTDRTDRIFFNETTLFAPNRTSLIYMGFSVRLVKDE